MIVEGDRDGSEAVLDVADKALPCVSEAFLFAASTWKGEELEAGIEAVTGPWLAELGNDVGSLAGAMLFARTVFVSKLAPGFFATSEDLQEGEFVHVIAKADFDESKVNRDSGGRFASTGESSPRSKKERDAAISALPKIRGDSIAASQADIDNHTKRATEIAARMSVAEQIAVRAYTDKDYEAIRAVESNSADAASLFTEQRERIKENIAVINRSISTLR